MFSESMEKVFAVKLTNPSECWQILQIILKTIKAMYFFFFHVGKLQKQRQGFPSKTRTKQGIWYLWHSEMYTPLLFFFVFSLKDHFMFNSPIFLNCFHLVFPSVSGCWPGFSWVQRHSLYYYFCAQPFTAKTKLWEKNKQTHPYLNI